MGITELFYWLPVPGNQKAVITPPLCLLVKKLVVFNLPKHTESFFSIKKKKKRATPFSQLKVLEEGNSFPKKISLIAKRTVITVNT